MIIFIYVYNLASSFQGFINPSRVFGIRLYLLFTFCTNSLVYLLFIYKLLHEERKLLIHILPFLNNRERIKK